MTDNLLPASDCPIRERVHTLLAYKLGWQEYEIFDHLHLVNELYVDSLDLIEIEISVSETFDIRISEKELLEMETVDDLCHIIKRLIAEQHIQRESVSIQAK